MAGEWYIQRDGQRFGPYTAAQLKQMAGTGQVLPVDMVSKGDGGPAKPASQIKGLFAPSSPLPPPQSIPIPPPSTSPMGKTGPFSDLSSRARTAIWVKILASVGLAVVVAGLLCPWYTSSAKNSYDISGMDNTPGMGRGGASNFGGAGVGGRSGVSGGRDSGVGDIPSSGNFEASASVTGLMSLPGLFVFLVTVAAGVSYFLPKKLYILISAGLACLLLIIILGSFAYGPSVDQEHAVGVKGFGAAASAKAGTSWGQFVSLFGNFAFLAASVMTLLGIPAVVAPKRVMRQRPSEPEFEL